MGFIADSRRRYGVGPGGMVLYLVLFLGGIGFVAVAGDVPARYGDFGDPELDLRTLAYGIPAFVYVIGLFGVTLGASNLPTYLRLASTDTVDTGAVTDGTSGRVVLRGTVEAVGGTVATPRGTPAVATTTRVLVNSHDDPEKARDSPANWGVAHLGEETTRFAVDDGSGPAVVEPGGVTLRLEGRERETVLAGADVPDGIREYLASVDVDAGAHLRVEERVLEPGEQGFVLGRADGGTVDASLVAEGDYAALVRNRVVTAGGVGVVAAAGGYLGLLFAAGLL